MNTNLEQMTVKVTISEKSMVTDSYGSQVSIGDLPLLHTQKKHQQLKSILADFYSLFGWFKSRKNYTINWNIVRDSIKHLVLVPPHPETFGSSTTPSWNIWFWYHPFLQHLVLVPPLPATFGSGTTPVWNTAESELDPLYESGTNLFLLKNLPRFRIMNWKIEEVMIEMCS